MSDTIAENAPEKAALPRFFIKVQGKDYKIFKRKPDRDAPYYVKVERRNKTYKRCTEKNTQDQAEIRAREIIDLILNDKVDELALQKLRGALKPAEEKAPATIGQLLGAFRSKAAVYLVARTATDYENALRKVIREGMGKPGLDGAAIEKLPCAVLTGGLVAAFEQSRLQAAGEDEEARQSALISINSYVRCARAVFKKKFLKCYVRDMGLLLPDLADFLTEELAAPARTTRQAAPTELVTKTFAAAKKLKEDDLPAFVAFLLGACSLRRGEIRIARRDWLQSEKGRFFLRISRKQKAGIIRIVPIPEAVATEIEAFTLSDCPERPEWDRDYILPAGLRGRGGQAVKERGRAQCIVERVDVWMRAQGWDTQHTLHELRAVYLRELRKEHGLEVAGEVGGHANLKVTREHYTGDLGMDLLGKEVKLPAMG